ncbi:MAG TPA: TIGR02265 family protein [Thermoanaerobaculia bacterium]|nr:TIGR02265 family protein [Thermoanaerobaculia bacterium]
MESPAKGKVKGGALQSRLQFVRDHRGDEGVTKVLQRLSEEDRTACQQILTGGWYPFDLNERLDEAIAGELGMGENTFLLIGEKSAAHNLGNAHRIFITDRDPHGLLRRAAQIYQAYYDTGHRTYEKLGEKKAVLRTHESRTYSKHDCLTVVGWHRKAIEMCGGVGPRITETKCRARGADVCEYVCEWS